LHGERVADDGEHGWIGAQGQRFLREHGASAGLDVK